MRAKRWIGAAAAAAIVAGILRERNSPSPCPYSQRWLLWFPRPFLGREALRQILEPRPGERVLEVGPGTGQHATLAMAGWAGEVVAVDVQDEMLGDLRENAQQRGIQNLSAQEADAQNLPFPDASFDAAYLVTVLGEVPDQDAALRELRRVLKPGGRVVFGETLLDPHYVSIDSLRERGAAAALRLERHTGRPPLGYYARLVPA